MQLQPYTRYQAVIVLEDGRLFDASIHDNMRDAMAWADEISRPLKALGRAPIATVRPVTYWRTPCEK